MMHSNELLRKVFLMTRKKNGLEKERLQTGKQEVAAEMQAREYEDMDSSNGRNI